MEILDFVFPKKCLGCGERGKYVCEGCMGKVKKAKQVCIECERPSIDGMTHSKCRRPWGLEACFSIWVYEGIVRDALIKLKYKFAFTIAEELAEYIYLNLVKKNVVLPTAPVLVPIPLHALRKNWRGFNQVEEIGKIVCRKMGWKYCPDVLIRSLPSRPQTELKGEERKQNIRGAFTISKECLSLVTSEQSLILFDDVLTTGATLREAVKVLKRNGIQEVWGLTIVR